MSLIQIPGSGPNLYLFQQGFVYMKTFFYIRKNQNHICTECPKSALREATHKCWDFSSWAHPQQKAEDTVSRIFCWSVLLCRPVNLLVWLSTFCLFAYFSVSFFPYLSITSTVCPWLRLLGRQWFEERAATLTGYGRGLQRPYLPGCRPGFPPDVHAGLGRRRSTHHGTFQWITEQKMMLPPVGL